MGYSLWDHEETDTTKLLCTSSLQGVAGEARASVGPVCPAHRHVLPVSASWSVVAAVMVWAL